MELRDARHAGPVELELSDQAQLGSLQEIMRLAAPEARVTRVAGHPGPGEQGSLDVLTVLASSSGLVAAIRILPAFLRSRKAGLSIKMTVNGKPFSLTATNVDDVMPILERLLDG
jgi:hypothetical protein